MMVPTLANAHSLTDLYRLAKAQDQTLQASLHSRDVALETRPEALSAFLPNLNASASVQRQRLNYLSTSSRFLTAGQTTYSSNEAWTVTLSQTIWSFESYSKLLESDAQVAAAENTYLQAQQDLVFRLTETYFGVLGAEDTVRADIAAKHAFLDQLNEARSRFGVGLGTIVDVEQAQASYDASRATLITDRQALQGQHEALAVIVDRNVGQLEPLEKNIPLIRPAPSSVKYWIKAATRDNFAVRAADLQWEIAKRDVAVKRAQYLPSLTLQGSVGQTNSGGQLGVNQRDYAVGLTLEIPIFQGGLIYSEVRQAVATAAQDHSLYRLSLRNAVQSIRNAFQAVISEISSVRAFKQAVKSARTALTSTKIGYRVGTQTEVDVLIAEESLFSALKSYYQSRYQYIDAVLALKQASGHLDKSDLQRVDGLLVGVARSKSRSLFPTPYSKNGS